MEGWECLCIQSGALALAVTGRPRIKFTMMGLKLLHPSRVLDETHLVDEWFCKREYHKTGVWIGTSVIGACRMFQLESYTH